MLENESKLGDEFWMKNEVIKISKMIEKNCWFQTRLVARRTHGLMVCHHFSNEKNMIQQKTHHWGMTQYWEEPWEKSQLDIEAHDLA